MKQRRNSTLVIGLLIIVSLSSSAQSESNRFGFGGMLSYESYKIDSINIWGLGPGLTFSFYPIDKKNFGFGFGFEPVYIKSFGPTKTAALRTNFSIRFLGREKKRFPFGIVLKGGFQRLVSSDNRIFRPDYRVNSNYFDVLLLFPEADGNIYFGTRLMKSVNFSGIGIAFGVAIINDHIKPKKRESFYYE